FTGNLMKLKATNDEERAFLLYYGARLEKSTQIAMASYNQLSQSFSGTRYGQMGILELAKMHILDRDIDKALVQLRKVTANELTEKTYWQAVCSFQQSDWQTAINHGENFLRINPNSIYTEEAHFLVADSYIYERKANSAINTLNKLKGIKDLPTDLQYFHYRLGYAYEISNSPKEAVTQYKTGYLLNKYSQIGYQIEDRLFAMRSTYGNSIDLSFLYPYVELSLSEQSQIQTPPPPPPSITPTSNGIDHAAPLKIADRPSGDYFIQAGRFSSEANAENLVRRIRGLEVHAVYYEQMHNNKMTWVVICGPYPTQQDAIFAHSKLRENEIDCFITRH
ncbi:MAG: SPOR domain-containing protein, partial [Candidatus Cloacimonadaceae bacterium]|nr:SPOR domain-containing protein [Candidatus Cloacimonadaceae bacterium]